MEDRPLDLAILKTFSPLDGLKAENLHALARKTQILELGAGRVLFKQGDTDKRTFYLVAGKVELRADDKLIGTVRAGSPEARAALAPGLPRKFTARAAIDLEYIDRHTRAGREAGRVTVRLDDWPEDQRPTREREEQHGPVEAHRHAAG